MGCAQSLNECGQKLPSDTELRLEELEHRTSSLRAIYEESLNSAKSAGRLILSSAEIEDTFLRLGYVSEEAKELREYVFVFLVSGTYLSTLSTDSVMVVTIDPAEEVELLGLNLVGARAGENGTRWGIRGPRRYDYVDRAGRAWVLYRAEPRSPSRGAWPYYRIGCRRYGGSRLGGL